MVKKNKLEAISYKTRRVKFGNNWFSVDPFMDLDPLKIGEEYEANFSTDKGIFYIETFTKVVI